MSNIYFKWTLGAFVSFILSYSGSLQAQWINPNIEREYNRPGGPVLCRVRNSDLIARRDFLKNLNKENKEMLKLARQTVSMTKDTLEDMEDAHFVSDVAEVVSSVAGLFVGGMAIRSLYFAGKSVSFLGLTVVPGTVTAHAYSAYAIASNGAPLAKQMIQSMGGAEKTPEEVLQEQMRQYRKEGLMSQNAVKFLLEPSWSGSSELLESPLIEGAMKSLHDFYDQERRKIGHNNSLWQSLGEFWHEKGLRHSALTYAVAKETQILQEMRVKYLEMLVSFLEQHRQYCYSPF